jgi:hypothetical protein
MIEIVMALSLLVIFFFVAGELFKSTVLLSAQSQQVSDDSNRIDSAMFQLRRDVWNSRQIAVADPRLVHLTASEGTQISWRINSSGDMTRTIAGGADETWLALAPGWSLTADGFSLSISDAQNTQPLRLTSQAFLAEKEPP